MMIIKNKKNSDPASSEITSRSAYLSRRQFITGAATAGALGLMWAKRPSRPSLITTADPAPITSLEPEAAAAAAPARAQTDELGKALTSFDDVSNYNNYYEFTTKKTDVARLSKDFNFTPWQIEVSGHVNKPGTYSMQDIRTKFDQEERIYRMRCVEAWSMVIPWNGFPLHKLLAEVEPTSKAKYVRFVTLEDRQQMPGLSSPWYEWPYVEGLRLDEAMHDLTMLSTGIYGEDLLPQNGAPIRLVVPWKYGFKSIKSIVKIELVEEMPVSLWMAAGPSEYGFYSNVNPSVSHPRWSQDTERRIGGSRIPTRMFNGYQEEVESLYTDLDLRINF